jgi:hypothetical protein
MTSQNKRYTRITNQIKKQYGTVIDLERSPSVLIEILRQYGRHFGKDEGTGGVKPSIEPKVSTIAVGPGPDPDPPKISVKPTASRGEEIENSVLLRAILTLHRDVKGISKNLNRQASKK